MLEANSSESAAHDNTKGMLRARRNVNNVCNAPRDVFISLRIGVCV